MLKIGNYPPLGAPAPKENVVGYRQVLAKFSLSINNYKNPMTAQIQF
jgi:hypothetical protein